MKNIYTFTLFLLFHYSSTAQIQKALLIGIDGCRPDGVQQANTPNMDALISNASYTWDAMNDGITYSGPGWGSLLTGVWPNKHGIVNNTFFGSNLNQYPHLFKRIEDYNSDLHTVSIVQWHPINNNIANGFVDTMINVADHSDFVGTATVDYLTNADPDAIFIHFDDVDHAGHGSGFTPNNPNYISAIEDVDENIGYIMTAMNNRPNIANENWVIIVSTDHGGINSSHGGNSFEERNIFMIVSGDSVPNIQVHADSTLTQQLPVSNCLADSVELYFDGDAKVTTALNPVFNFGASQDFTVECRIRTTSSGDVAIVTDKDWDSGLLPGWVFSFNVGGGPWKVNVGDGSDRVDLEGGIIDDNEWHTLSATFDRDGMMTIYEDGTQVDQGSLGAIDDIYTGFPISMGKDAEDDYAYTGNIAEVRIFDGLVAPSDIDNWKCTVLNNTHPNYGNLLGYWRMTDGGGSPTVADFSSTNANGTIAGAEWQSADDTVNVWTYDYSTTPKQVDFAISALEHLCIPIDAAWDLDGQPFGTSNSCLATGIGETPEQNGGLILYPNPAHDQVQVLWNGLDNADPGQLEVIDAIGQLVFSRPIAANSTLQVNVKDLPTGVYTISVLNSKGERSLSKFVRNRN